MSNIDLKISVITISRNSQEFIEDTIRSVVSQTYKNLEYIVIDGASTDSTVEIIKQYDSKITKWVSEPDKGISDAFNKGFSQSSGDYLLFLNSDDALAEPAIIEKMVEAIKLNDFPEFIYGNYNIIHRTEGHLLYEGSVNFSPAKMQYGQVLPQPTLLVRRKYFDQYGIFDLSFKIAMDYEWMLRGILKERVVHLPWLITIIRDGGVSTVDQRKVISEILQALKKNNFFKNIFSYLKIKFYFYSRYYAKKILTSLGLYRLIFNFRKRVNNA